MPAMTNQRATENKADGARAMSDCSSECNDARDHQKRQKKRGRRVCLVVDEEDLPIYRYQPSDILQKPRKDVNPAPVGLMGFGMTTMLLNLHNIGLFPVFSVVPAMAISFGGFTQVVVGLLEYLRGNTFGYISFTSYGVFWISLFAVWYLQDSTTSPTSPIKPTDAYFMGIYLLIWGIFSFVLFLCTLRTNAVVIFCFFNVTCLYLFLALGNMTNSKGTIKAAGYFGIFCASAAMYLGFTDIVNGVYEREILPVWSVEKFWKKKKEDTKEELKNGPV